jgi:hypothetical protein
MDEGTYRYSTAAAEDGTGAIKSRAYDLSESCFFTEVYSCPVAPSGSTEETPCKLSGAGPRAPRGISVLNYTINRRDFLITTAATAALSAWPFTAAFSEQMRSDALRSALAPVIADGMRDVARNRAAYQSSCMDDDHTAHLVTDGSASTYWEGEPGTDQWIRIDLGEVRTLHRLTIHWREAFPGTYRVEASLDGVEPIRWDTLHSISDAAEPVYERPLHSAHARHLRLIGSSPSNGRGLAISGIEAWSEPLPSQVPNPYPTVEKSGTSLTSGWSLQSAMFTLSEPEQISSARYSDPGWLPAIVPGTVLACYLQAGAIPDPFYRNQQSQISEQFFTDNDFWYRNVFSIPSQCKGRRLWLVFHGINWKADIFFNGAKFGEIDGAFIRGRFEVSKSAVYGGENCAAVLVHKVAHPGPVQHKQLGKLYRNGGVLGLDCPTFLASIGWNWLPTIRGRNTGIWNDVRFETSGDVVLLDPWITTDELSPGHDRAEITARAELSNLSGEPKVCILALFMEGASHRQQITLGPHETRTIAIDKAIWPALAVEKPLLWWPNGYGEPVLHTMRWSVECDGAESDDKTVTFGIRKIEYQTDGGILQISVNGHKILCRGGNWGMDDGMLMCDENGYDLRLRMHRDMHLVMIRNWVGMVGSEKFYDACDRHGMLIWDDFWLANPGDAPDPSDHAMFMRNVRDKVRRVRCHPALALYCGRNEGDPPPDLDLGMRDAVSQLDGTRFYIPASASGLVTGHGPYDNQDPAWYFANRGNTFHSEQGIVCVPPVESMRAMMPEASLWPTSDMWAIHDYQDPRSVLYTKRICDRYGAATGIEDYCCKAQMVNLESAKAIYESLQSRQGAGLLVWMTQAAWPALICQLYDYSFEQTGAYFGAKTGCRPLHILWDQHSNVVKVANNTTNTENNLHAEGWIYDFDGHERWHRSSNMQVPSAAARSCFPLAIPEYLDRVFFVKLKLSRGTTLLSENFYWSPARDGDCTALHALPTVRLFGAASMKTDNTHTTGFISISNPGPALALAIRVKLVHASSGERVLPALYEDNYFSLLPQESRKIKFCLPFKVLAAGSLRLTLKGWNVEDVSIETH